MRPDALYSPGRELARGGMGAVVDARDHRLGRSVAMKVMLRRGAGAMERHRFLQEARVLGQLAHPHIVPVYNLGSDPEGRPFYTMKLVEGVTLHEVIGKLKSGDREMIARYPLTMLLTVFQKACDAMAFAHSRGVLHRDLKPQNVMVGVFGEVMVMDWGLAKILPGSPAAQAMAGAASLADSSSKPSVTDAFSLEGDASATDDQASNAAFRETVADGAPSVADQAESVAVTSAVCSAGATSLDEPALTPDTANGIAVTLDGAVVGTPHYMSPEQAQGRVNELDARSDIFSLGAILYELLALRPPVEGRSPDEVLEKARAGTIPPPTVPFVVLGAQRGMKEPVLNAAPPRSLPHIPGGHVPTALSAVAMKALRADKMERYQSVAALSAEVAAYQAGFATAAEEASTFTQFVLLIRRNRALSAALAVLLVSSVGFLVKLMSSEREARRHEGIAQTNERQAIAEKEAARRALATSALALAEAALRDGNGQVMRAALQQVPKDLRDATWSYLSSQADTSIPLGRLDAFETQAVAAHPHRAGMFAVADKLGRVTILELRTGKQLLQFQTGWGESGAALRVAFSPDGERIAIGRSVGDGGIVIHRGRDGEKVSAWSAPLTKRLEFSPDGQWLLQTEARRASIKMWNPATGQLAWEQKTGDLHDLGAFTPEGHVLVHGGRNGIRLVQARDGALIRQISSLVPSSFAISPDGARVVVMVHRGGIQGFNLKDGSTNFEFRPPQSGFRAHQNDDGHLAFTPDGLRLVSVTSLPDGRQAIQLWDANTGSSLPPLLGGSGRANDACVHPISGELVVAGAQMKAWDLTGAAAKWSLPAPANPSLAFWGADDLVFAPDSGTKETGALHKLEASPPIMHWKPPGPDRYLASATADGQFAILGPRTGRVAKSGYDLFFLKQPDSRVQRVTVAKPSANLTHLCLGPTGDQWATIQRFHAEVCVYSRDSEPPSAKLDLKDMIWFWDIGWLNSNRLIGLATAHAPRGDLGSEDRIVVWDTTTGQIIKSAINPAPMNVLAVSPDRRCFAEAGTDKRVCIRDATTLALLREFRAHNDRITALVWHPKKPLLATASEDMSVKLWNVETMQVIKEFRGPITPPVRLAFSPGGRRLACASPNDAVRIWEIE